MIQLDDPTPRFVDDAIATLKNDPKVIANNGVLAKLFALYPTNTEIEEVYLKVVALNQLYSTNIFEPYAVAKHIVESDIDNKLSDRQLELVAIIANVPGKFYKNERDKTFYSFATKYCYWHQHETYPIYDSYVANALWHYKVQRNYAAFAKPALKDYLKYIEILNKFREGYQLSNYSIREIDNFLWVQGKKLAPERKAKASKAKASKTLGQN